MQFQASISSNYFIKMYQKQDQVQVQIYLFLLEEKFFDHSNNHNSPSQIFRKMQSQTKKYPIYLLLVSFNHAGDYNQALQVSNSYAKLQKIFDIQIINIQKNYLQKINQLNPLYCHSIGQKAMIALKKLKQQNSEIWANKIIIVQIHQHFPELLYIRPHILVIPEATYVEKQELQTTFKILLKGIVFQKISDEKLQQIFKSSQISKDVNLNQNYIIVMLSGDAPDQQKMRFFTKESADLLFTRLIFLLGRLSTNGQMPKIIVQNGPRTGKHQPQTSKQICLHKFNEGQDPSCAIDKISQYFINKLTEVNIPYIFYNFAFEIQENGRKIHSYYKPLLYVAKQKNNLFLFPMQSVSMCSQLPYYIQSSRLIAYHSSSTNESHLKVVEAGYNKGLYRKYQQNKLNILNPQKEITETFDETIQYLSKIINYLKNNKQKQKI